MSTCQTNLRHEADAHVFTKLQEWNYHSRQNAKQGHLIAEQAKKDSEQMTTIARLGMIFLPGTFLAVRPQEETSKPRHALSTSLVSRAPLAHKFWISERVLDDLFQVDPGGQPPGCVAILCHLRHFGHCVDIPVVLQVLGVEDMDYM